MGGRKPKPLYLDSKDIPILRQIARSQSLPWYQVRRARTVLAMAEGQRIQTVAFQMQCAPRTVRRTGLLYQAKGLPGLLTGPRRPGRPARISPPATGATGATGLPGAAGQRAPYYPLVER